MFLFFYFKFMCFNSVPFLDLNAVLLFIMESANKKVFILTIS